MYTSIRHTFSNILAIVVASSMMLQPGFAFAQAPTLNASFTWTETSELTVEFDGSDSTPAADIDIYEWDFNEEGDGSGTTATGQTASFTFPSAGTYSVALLVTDTDSGTTDLLVQDVTVGGGDGSGDACLANAVIERVSESGRTVTFTSESSTAGEGFSISARDWTVDGTVISTNEEVTYTFPDSPDDFTLELTVETNQPDPNSPVANCSDTFTRGVSFAPVDDGGGSGDGGGDGGDGGDIPTEDEIFDTIDFYNEWFSEPLSDAETVTFIAEGEQVLRGCEVSQGGDFPGSSADETSADRILERPLFTETNDGQFLSMVNAWRIDALTFIRGDIVHAQEIPTIPNFDWNDFLTRLNLSQQQIDTINSIVSYAGVFRELIDIAGLSDELESLTDPLDRVDRISTYAGEIATDASELSQTFSDAGFFGLSGGDSDGIGNGLLDVFSDSDSAQNIFNLLGLGEEYNNLSITVTLGGVDFTGNLNELPNFIDENRSSITDPLGAVEDILNESFADIRDRCVPGTNGDVCFNSQYYIDTFSDPDRLDSFIRNTVDNINSIGACQELSTNCGEDFINALTTTSGDGDIPLPPPPEDPPSGDPGDGGSGDAGGGTGGDTGGDGGGDTPSNLSAFRFSESGELLVRETRDREKDQCLDGIAQYAANNAIQGIGSSLTQWVQENFTQFGQEGNPGYVQDLEQRLANISAEQYREFITGVTQDGQVSPEFDSVCNAFRNDLVLSLDEAYRSNQDDTAPAIEFPDQSELISDEEGAGCLLEQVILNRGGSAEDVEAFLEGDFSQGGWDAWNALFTDPQSSPQGAYLQTQANLNRQIDEQQLIDREQLQWGRGYLAFEDGDSFTPASTVESSINRLAQSDITRLELVDEMNEIVPDFTRTFIYQIANRGLSEIDYLENVDYSPGGSGGGIDLGGGSDDGGGSGDGGGSDDGGDIPPPEQEPPTIDDGDGGIDGGGGTPPPPPPPPTL